VFFHVRRAQMNWGFSRKSTGIRGASAQVECPLARTSAQIEGAYGMGSDTFIGSGTLQAAGPLDVSQFDSGVHLNAWGHSK
jgi:hypothetical protein